MAQAPRSAAAFDPVEVAAWLRARPRFLTEHPELYRWLVPPERVHGDVFADHMVAMLRAERAHAAAMAERADGVLAAGRAAAGLASRVQEAVLALIGATNPVECVAAELPPLLAVDAVSLCAETAPAPIAGARPLPPGMVSRLMSTRFVLFRDDGAEARMLHGEAAELARHDVLVRIPGDGTPALLALAARDRRTLDPSQGAGALTFLGRAMAAALGR